MPPFGIRWLNPSHHLAQVRRPRLSCALSLSGCPECPYPSRLALARLMCGRLSSLLRIQYRRPRRLQPHRLTLLTLSLAFNPRLNRMCPRNRHHLNDPRSPILSTLSPAHPSTRPSPYLLSAILWQRQCEDGVPSLHRPARPTRTSCSHCSRIPTHLQFRFPRLVLALSPLLHHLPPRHPSKRQDNRNRSRSRPPRCPTRLI